ncbi:hypothetical protein AX14_004763 [Amanita brunnescens Koide BX004]|nr:hypothetical protein AX14_004763 [Amanita brunnescens Koide BX004]
MAFNPRPGAKYHIINAESGTLLDLSGTDRKYIIGWPNNGGDNQKWYFEYSEYLGGYTLKNVKYGKYVGYQSAIHGSLAVGIPGQRSWTIGPDRQDPDRFRIVLPRTSLLLELSNQGSDRAGTPVVLAAWSARAKHQTWRIVEA